MPAASPSSLKDLCKRHSTRSSLVRCLLMATCRRPWVMHEFFFRLLNSSRFRLVLCVPCMIAVRVICTRWLKNDTDVAHYYVNAHQPILIIFGRDIAVRVCCQMMIFFPPFLTNVSALPGETRARKLCLFSLAVIPCLQMTLLWLAISPKSVDVLWSYIVLYRCRFLRHSAFCMLTMLENKR